MTLCISKTVVCSSEGVRESKLDGLLVGLSWNHKHFMKSNLELLARLSYNIHSILLSMFSAYEDIKKFPFKMTFSITVNL